MGSRAKGDRRVAKRKLYRKLRRAPATHHLPFAVCLNPKNASWLIIVAEFRLPFCKGYWYTVGVRGPLRVVVGKRARVFRRRFNIRRRPCPLIASSSFWVT